MNTNPKISINLPNTPSDLTTAEVSSLEGPNTAPNLGTAKCHGPSTTLNLARTKVSKPDWPAGGRVAMVPNWTGQACAACKYQRRRCAHNCPLAPYFPGNKQHDFLNVHRLYGVCGIVRVLKSVPTNQRGEAMKSLIYESNMRSIDPVGGCNGVISILTERLNLLNAELDLVLKRLAICKKLNYRVMPNSNGRDGIIQKIKGKQPIGVRNVLINQGSSSQTINHPMLTGNISVNEESRHHPTVRVNVSTVGGSDSQTAHCPKVKCIDQDIVKVEIMEQCMNDEPMEDIKIEMMEQFMNDEPTEDIKPDDEFKELNEFRTKGGEG